MTGSLSPDQVSERAWHNLSPDQVLAVLETNETGLESADVEVRRAAFGANVLPRRERLSLLVIYLRQFKSPLVYLLLVAAAVSLAVGELTDAVFIFVVLQVNAAIGSYQEYRAEASAAALDALVPNFAVAVRDGAPRQVDARDLVPGDIVRMVSGALVPADMRLLADNEFAVDESLLTGESVPVEKNANMVVADDAPLAERSNMLYAATTVLSGRVTGIVTATGAATEVGRIAVALAHRRVASPPLVTRLARFGRIIGVVTLLSIGLIGAIQLAQGVPLVTVFLVAVALAVAAIPEGLPAAITIALAVATNRMARRNVIVRALPAVEGLGACTVIASDKTGTLTCNELTVKQVLLFGDAGQTFRIDIGGEGYLPIGGVTTEGRDLIDIEERLLIDLAVSGALCNEATLRIDGATVEHVGDTVDVAFLVLAAKLGLQQRILQAEQPQLGLIPYEPRRKFAALFTRNDQGHSACAHVKGAAEVIVPMCDGIDADTALAAADHMATQGYRVLALARGTVPMNVALKATQTDLQGLQLIGLVGLIDPLRPEVPVAIAQCRAAGIDVRMITGDHPQTALAIARDLGLADTTDRVVTGAELSAANRNPAEFDHLASTARIFARVEPVQKLSIVEALQRAGHVVAVTGDGVNDAPALSAADIGVAMGRGGTDAARAAADLILADDNLATIVPGIEEGRIAYDNVRKLIYLLITTGLGEIVLFLLSIIAQLPVPLFAVQLLWLNLVTNGIQDIALAFEKGEPGVLERQPRPPHERLFERRMITQVLVAGTYMGGAAFAFYAWSLDRGFSEPVARNLLLLLMVMFENMHALNARSETRSVFRIPFAANPFLIIAIVAAQGLHITAMYVPGLNDVLGLQPVALADWLMVAAVAASLLIVGEILKMITVAQNRRN
ncbi:MAG: HAD-IC family P-type ATPase [Alphaproteobacteria bacterium]|nr:HAD-IC family P-type ATPase [Alphaproteobacteria bacterium]